jgi:ornithine cyclodeaminase/alanine dehydrogenase-like protein (mu-crystallin family)
MLTKPKASHSSNVTILTASDVFSVISTINPELAIVSQQNAFLALASQFAKPSDTIRSIQGPPRITLKSEHMTSLFMPSRVADAGGMACKIVSVPTNGGEGGLPATTVLINEETGKVKAVINARRLTALRNACGRSSCSPRMTPGTRTDNRTLYLGSALFLRTLPPKQPPRNLLIFGSGAQAQAHATLFLRLFPSFTSCTLVVRQASPRAESLLAELEGDFPNTTFKLRVSTVPGLPTPGDGEQPFNLSQAVHNANVILTLTPSTSPLFNSVDVTSGTHLVLVGSFTPAMREVDADLIRRAGLVVVDTKHGCSQEAGELIAASVGPDGMVELKDLLAEPKFGESIMSSGDVVIFKSVCPLPHFRNVLTETNSDRSRHPGCGDCGSGIAGS